MPRSLHVYADLRVSRDGAEIGINANGDEININTDFRSLVFLFKLAFYNKSAVHVVDQHLRELGLTLRYQRRFVGFSILGCKANRGLISFLSFLLRIL